MITLQQLCENINMPDEVTQKLVEIDGTIDYSSLSPMMEQLCARSTWVKALEELRTELGEDADGFRMLTCMLHQGLDTYRKYQEQGIDVQIFFDTFACFSRFVREHQASYDVYGFDRAFWTPRQLAMEEFRIGELEYEKDSYEGKSIISVHIPSDAKIDNASCEASYQAADVFLERFLPEYKNVDRMCDSWLMSPELPKVLAEGSNILQFQGHYEIIHFEPENNEFLEWIFGDTKIPLAELPEKTSLQRNIKNHLQNGGNIGSALGVLKLYHGK